MTDPSLRCVTGCGRPSPDAFLCATCTRELLTDLRTVPWLCRQLDITLARQDRVAPAAGAGPEADTPLPAKLRATQATTTLRYTLGPWVRTIAEQRAVTFDCADTPQDLARWLADHIDSVRQSDEAAQLVDEVRYAIDQAHRAIDQPPMLCYRGPCDQCGTDLYCGADHRGRPTVSVITCRTCDTGYDTADREDWLLAQAEDRLATATEIAQAIPALYGTEIKYGTIRQWISRGRLLPRAWLHNGHAYPQRQHQRDRPLCRIGDVIDLARQVHQRDQRDAS